MKRLNYSVLKDLDSQDFFLEKAPERVLQFGEGNFLRAFVDYFFDVANEKAGFNGKVVLCQPIANGTADFINEQEGLYTLYLRGFENSKEVNQKRVVSSVSRCINPYSDFNALLDCAKNPDLRYLASNTTEAGIVFDDSCSFSDAPPASFPAKLTRFLYERYRLFGDKPGKGFVILSCELIDNNGKELQKCVEQYCRLWNLGEAFARWVAEENIFCSTLVDRIVTGYPRAEAEELNRQNGYEDKLLDTGEIFGFWVIEGPESLEKELPFQKAGLPVIVVRDHTPYKQRKVRILNGAHTSMVLAAYLAGQDIVRDCMKDPVIRRFMDRAVHKEIIPTLALPRQELEDFANAVAERFQNPFIDHALRSIALNSTSKWRARVLPSVKGYFQKFNALPPLLTFSFAAYITFYHNGKMTDKGLFGIRGEDTYQISDDQWVLEFYADHQNGSGEALARAVCSNEKMWGEDLTSLPGFAEAVAGYLGDIEKNGMYAAMKAVCGLE